MAENPANNNQKKGYMFNPATTPKLCKFLVETWGNSYCVRFPANYEGNTLAENLFANLAWVCGQDEEASRQGYFFTRKDVLRKAIRAFRIMETSRQVKQIEIAEKWLCPLPRSKGKFALSPFGFTKGMQLPSDKKAAALFWANAHSKGNANYSNATDSEFTGFRSRLEAHFDKVA